MVALRPTVPLETVDRVILLPATHNLACVRLVEVAVAVPSIGVARGIREDRNGEARPDPELEAEPNTKGGLRSVNEVVGGIRKESLGAAGLVVVAFLPATDALTCGTKEEGESEEDTVLSASFCIPSASDRA